MIKKLLILLIFPIFLFSIETYENKNVAEVEVTVEGKANDAFFDTNSILMRLKTRKNAPFSQTNFDHDLKMLSEEYDQVTPETRLQDDQLFITIYLIPRPLIHQIIWRGNERIKTKKLQKELGVKPLTVFNRQDFAKKFNKVKDFYLKKGFFESQLSYQVEPAQEADQVDILIDVFEGRSGNIKKIVLKGFTSKEKSHIQKMIFTKKYNFLMSWLTGDGSYREEVLEQDKMSILNYLNNKGYADARVDISHYEDEKGKIIIEIVAQRGNLYRFGEITFEGNELLTNEEVEKLFLFKSNDVFSPDKLRETAQAIKDYYGQKGHIEANVYFETYLLENEPVYNVYYKIEEGEQFRIGLIRIFGNTQTKDNVILRESLLVPGELFDSRKLKVTQMRLESMGYFKNVNVYTVKSSEDLNLGPNYKDVYIEVEETTTGNVSLFVGFSTQDSVYGGLELTERNFNIAGFRHLFQDGPSALRGGGEYAHVRISPGRRQTNYLISWMTPYLNDTLWRLGFDLSRTTSRLQSRDYDVDTIGFSLFTSYPITNFWTFGTKYRFRNARTSVKDKNSRADKDKFGKKDGLISALGTSMTYDSTDSIQAPRRGLRSSLEFEVAGLGGDFHFYKLTFINTLYQYVWSKGTLKFRADLKFIDTYGSKDKFFLSMSERFFLGGETSVRGVKPYILGDHSDDGEPLGGISSTLLSAEYSQHIFEMASAFAFVDAGSISFNKFSIPTFNAMYGIGMRLQLMNRTPIMFGWGFPIHLKRKSDRKSFFFSMGGQF